jgi:hypothetical protein
MIREATSSAETPRIIVGMLSEPTQSAYRFSLTRLSLPTFSRR